LVRAGARTSARASLGGRIRLLSFGTHEFGIHVGPVAAPASGTTLSFEVDDVLTTHAELVDRGIVFTEPPLKKAWGYTVAELSDPVGHTVYLMSRS
jgi:uncharacterized glyoxalase superfamily protein PhnB